MKDRQPTQVLANGAIRYGIYNADGTLNHYEYLKREDAPTVEGTPLNKANLLSDATAAKIWPSAATRPEDPTVNNAFEKLTNGTAKIGDIAITSRSAPSDSWLLCNGQSITQADYPELFDILRVSATPAPWEAKTVASDVAVGTTDPKDHISNANGQWFRSVSMGDDNDQAVLYRSIDLVSWEVLALPTASQLRSAFGFDSGAVRIEAIGPVHFYKNQYVACISVAGYYSTSWMTWIGVMYKSNLGSQWALVQTDPVWEDHSSGRYDGSEYDILYGDGTYAIFSYYGILTSSSLTGEWTRTMWRTSLSGSEYYYVGAPVFNPYDGYWYGLDINNTSCSLLRTKNPANPTWDTFGNGSAEYTASPYVLCSENAIFILAGNNTYKYALNGSSTFITKTAAGLAGYDGCGVCTNDLFVCYSRGSNKIYISDDLSDGFQTVDMSMQIQEFAYKGNTIVGAVKSGGLTISVVTRDFSSDAKKVPTIVPDSRSYAYIKAQEE